jgi:hypothetical protein
MKKVMATHSELFQHIANTIAQRKRQIVGVGKDKNTPAFAYTIGNQEKGLPELLIVGNFDPKLVTLILDRMSDQMLEQGKPFDDGTVVNFGSTDSVAVWNTNAAALRYTYQAGQFYGNEDYKVQQVVMPDRKGRYPEDPLCHKGYKVPVMKSLKLSS